MQDFSRDAFKHTFTMKKIKDTTSKTSVPLDFTLSC